MKSYGYGFPRLGKNREHKRVIENYWRGGLTEEEMLHSIDSLEETRLARYKSSVDIFPVGEMTLYCLMLDTAIMVGLYPKKGVNDYFALCRGEGALKLRKWFNTNYHYLVPDFRGFSPERFRLNWNKPKEELEKQQGIPYLIGPFTFLKLSTGIPEEKFGDYFFSLIGIYKEIIKGLREVHIDEPAFVFDLSKKEIEIIKEGYRQLNGKIYLFTYYEGVDFLKSLYDLPIEGLGLDLIDGKKNLRIIEEYGFPEDKYLIAGIVNGRNVWKTDIRETKELIEHLYKFTEKMMLSNSSPLYHLPITVKGEELDEALLSRLAFAEERLDELRMLATDTYPADYGVYKEEIGLDMGIRERVSALTEDSFKRETPYQIRQTIQKRVLGLPLFPVTTIGSFPQTKEIRGKRRDWTKDKIGEKEYSSFIKEKIRELIRLEEELGLDVLVHGEFERTDMVEFFAKKLGGIATTKNGWIISYGTRGYRPPIIYADVKRETPMTVDEITYAQSRTSKPVKAILTGPVTIIAWSFIREDMAIRDVAYQIALSLQDEVSDLEKANIKIVQIDEPAFREMTPIKRRDWDDYFNWAINSFRLAGRAKPATQLHTHMCYSDFGEILDQILKMDFDVISIEASRSRGELIDSFRESGFDRGIGLGVWDIHSPIVPSNEAMKGVIERAMKFIPRQNIWINPDCGLKTRNWKEVKESIRNMVDMAKEMRSHLSLSENT